MSRNYTSVDGEDGNQPSSAWPNRNRRRAALPMEPHSPTTSNSVHAESPLPTDSISPEPSREYTGNRYRFPPRSEDSKRKRAFKDLAQSLNHEQSLLSLICSKWAPITLVSLIVLFIYILLFRRDSFYVATLRMHKIPPGLYSRDGTLYVGRETPFAIKGVSWYGFEEPSILPGGMNVRSATGIMKFLKAYKFNAIRLPLSADSIMKNPAPPTTLSIFRNPSLVGAHYLDMVKGVVRLASEHSILILVDLHRLQSDQVQSPGLWYKDDIGEEQLLGVWKKLCELLKDEWNVMGADLFNEPWNALWNTSTKDQDWKYASERMGNLVHQKCPSWLVMIQGVGGRAGGITSNPFWAENLAVMEPSPPELKLKNKVALSPHVYGPSVHMQQYFKSDDFASHMPQIWDEHFGNSSQKTGLATIIGEWGGKYTSKDKAWQDKFMTYIVKKNLSFFYWCLNPESADTGGLLKSDWKTPEREKLNLLSHAPSTSVEDNALHFQYWRSWRT